MKRRLLVDCTDSYLRPEFATGIQRVTRELAARCGSQSPEGWQAMPVYHLHGMWCLARLGRLHRLLKLARVCRKNAHGAFRFFHGSQGFARWIRLPLWLPLRLVELVATLGVQLARTTVHVANLPSAILLRHGDVLLHPEYPLGHIRSVTKAKSKGVAVVPVIHDVLRLTHPHLFGHDPKVAGWFGWVADNATSILCVSKTTAKAVTHCLSPGTIPVNFFHLGADFYKSPGPIGCPAPSRTRRIFLMVGTLEPRKRHADVLVAFERLWAEGEDMGLHIIGKPGWMTEDVIGKLRNHPEANRRLVWTAGATDADLERAYSAAHAVIAASEAEGFGLPVVEALSRGTPVIASDIPVFREIAGRHADFFPMGDSAALAEIVRHLAAAPRRSVHGFRWPSWDEATRRALALATLPRTGPDLSGLE